MFDMITKDRVRLLTASVQDRRLLMAVFLLSAFRRIFRFRTRLHTAQRPRQGPYSRYHERHGRLRFFTGLAVIAFLNFFRRYRVFIRRLFLQRDSAVRAGRLFALFIAPPMDANGARCFGDLRVEDIQRIQAATRINGHPLHVNYSLAIFRFTSGFYFVFFTSIARRFRNVYLQGILAFSFLFLHCRFRRFYFSDERVAFFSYYFAQVRVVMRPIFGDQSSAGLSTKVWLLRDFDRRIDTKIPRYVLAFLIFPLRGFSNNVLISQANRIPGLAVRTHDRGFLYRAKASTFHGLRNDHSFNVFFCKVVQGYGLCRGLFAVGSWGLVEVRV